jgi:hypothetical protein
MTSASSGVPRRMPPAITYGRNVYAGVGNGGPGSGSGFWAGWSGPPDPCNRYPPKCSVPALTSRRASKVSPSWTTILTSPKYPDAFTGGGTRRSSTAGPVLS